MELRLFHALWGMDGTLREKLLRASDNGYTGIESPLPSVDEENEFKELIEEFELQYIPQLLTSGNHQQSFAELLDRSKSFRPLLVNVHSASDYMSEAEQDNYFEFALNEERRQGIPVAHETHRGRAMFTPHATARLLRRFPELKITADFSHFTCVCESMLHDQEEDVSLAISRSLHLHCRVGYAEGPQVPHPGAPEYAEELARFEQWWMRIWEQRKADGAAYATVTPEFGPPGYMPRLPFTNEPVADLFEVNQWMANRVRTIFK